MSPKGVAKQGGPVQLELSSGAIGRPEQSLLKSLSGYLSRVTVAPITSSIRGDNLVTVNQEGLGRRLTQLSARRMREVCAALGFALGCDG